MKRPTANPIERDTFSENCSSFFREIQIEFLIHELKDPVSIVETGARTLLERTEKYGALSTRQEKTLKRILRNARKTQGMLNDLLEIGRSEAGCFVCCTFRPAQVIFEALTDALETVSIHVPGRIKASRHEKDLFAFLSDNGILMDIDDGLIQMEMQQDEIKFRQIVGNLIKNALYHRNQRIEVKIDRETDHLILDIADDGPGIDPEHQQMIFRRYAQVNDQKALARKGHGIGLAGALICAKSIGGDIKVKSQKGKGAIFRLILPIISEKKS